MPGTTVDSKLATVAGRHAAKLTRAFGYVTVGDLLEHYPRRYVVKGELSDLAALTPDEHVTVIARVESSRSIPYRDRRSGRTAYRLEVLVATGDHTLTLTFFDTRPGIARWRAEKIVAGKQGYFAGRLGRFRDRWQLTNPDFQVFDDTETGPGSEQAQAAWASIPNLMPIYPATATVSSWRIQAVIALALQNVEDVPDPVPEDVRRARGLLTLHRALECVHAPDSWAEKEKADATLRFREAFVAQTVLAQRRARTTALPAVPRTAREGGLLERFDASLPFRLTTGQVEVAEQILADLAAAHPMHRLLQGEVGSGKTVVALRAMLRVVDSGGQAALLAPTEVLALQHHRSITTLLGDLAAGGMLGGAADGTRVALLTGSAGAAARRSAMLDAASGAAGIVVGTHALLEEKVQFADLGLVVVDEQHRFGVEQRAALGKKGEVPPHVLVMTATPIPRTVAMTVFGDLETSTMTEVPAGRAGVQTSIVPLLERTRWLERAWERVREEVSRGRQVYVVCPRIGGGASEAAEHGHEDAAEQEVPLAAVDEVEPALAQGVLSGLRLGALHGRLDSERKERVMQQFAAGEIDVLVSTTVIEVGVDVPNATVMLVLDADRFGVSQLHQLRGRVGRGAHQGLCLLVTRADAGSEAMRRLEAVAATPDGFTLSQLDLEQRREGDVLGPAQSGSASHLRKLSVLRHGEVISDAREAASDLVAHDVDLVGYPALAEVVRALAESERADYLEKA